ncbi:MAG: hypothetical protein LBD40_01280 [Puniceicoccales bacterium]|jgi:hypothetical protein|nr:hypothetical protein [Puniceicoccales bacterium]
MQKRIGTLGILGIALLGVCDVKGEPPLLCLKNAVDRGTQYIRSAAEGYMKRIQENVGRLERIGRFTPSPWAKAEAELVGLYPFLVNLGPDTFLNPNNFPALFFPEEFFVGTEAQWWQQEWSSLRRNIDGMKRVATYILDTMNALERLVHITEASPYLQPGTDMTIDPRTSPPPFRGEEDPPSQEESTETFMEPFEAQLRQGEEQFRQALRQYLPDEEAISQCIATINEVLQRHSLELDARDD